MSLWNSHIDFFFSSGLEHHLRQLADFCLPHVVVYAVDGEGPEALRHVVLSVHGRLRQPTHSPAVHLEFRGNERDRSHSSSPSSPLLPLLLICLIGDTRCSANELSVAEQSLTLNFVCVALFCNQPDAPDANCRGGMIESAVH